ncbi:MAG: helix-turn-helix transcriptional regulator [Actinomycetota bacterium]
MTLWTTSEREDPELGRWRTWRRATGAAVRPFAPAVTGYDQHSRSGGVHVTPANSMVPLVIPLVGRHRIHSPGRDPQEVPAFLAGIVDGAGSVEADAFCGLQVDLTPIGAYRLTGGALGELAGGVASLEDVLGPGARRLIERLGNTDGWPARFDVLEEFLTTRIESGPEPAPEVVEAWDVIGGRGGRVSVADLAREVGWSPRHLRQRMRRQLGVPPKVLARIVRFQHALRMLEGARRGDLGKLAHATGYYDQAHFTNEVSSLAGRSPLDYAAFRSPA